MACIINAESGTGLTNSADGSGVIKLQSAGKTTNALAWVNFNGTGTVAIRSSYNVSSITDNGTGDYTVNFATALSDANYVPVFGGSPQNGRWLCNYGGTFNNGTTQVVNSVNSVRVSSADNAGSFADFTNAYVVIFGN